MAHEQHSNPHEVKNAIEKHPEHPGRACGNLCDVCPEAVLGVGGLTVETPVRNTTINHPADHEKQEEQVTHKVPMVPCTYTIAHPRAVMIKFCYTAVAHATMFGPHRFPYQTGTAEYTEVQASRFCKFDYCLFLLFLCSFNNPWI